MPISIYSIRLVCLDVLQLTIKYFPILLIEIHFFNTVNLHRLNFELAENEETDKIPSWQQMFATQIICDWNKNYLAKNFLNNFKGLQQSVEQILFWHMCKKKYIYIYILFP